MLDRIGRGSKQHQKTYKKIEKIKKLIRLPPLFYAPERKRKGEKRKRKAVRIRWCGCI
jgi:hypothetical protein